MDRRIVLAVGLVGALIGVGFLWLLNADSGGGNDAPVRVVGPSPRLPAAARQERVALTPPPGREAPAAPPPSERVQANLTPEDRGAMNTAVDDAVAAAREECLRPWLVAHDEVDPAEFVFDAVTYDGRMVDVGIRSLTHDLPADVVTCVADKAWDAEWPEWDVTGELRLQRHFEVNPRKVSP